MQQSEESSPVSVTLNKKDDNALKRCAWCKKEIKERHLLSIERLNLSWHVTCLRCDLCERLLDDSTKCFIKNGLIICSQHPDTNSSSSSSVVPHHCAKCSIPLEPRNWVLTASRSADGLQTPVQLLYHMVCFSCEHCKAQMSSGDEFAFDDTGRLLCRKHYVRAMTSSPMSDSDEGDGLEGVRPRKRRRRSSPTRSRTAFTDEQLEAFEAQLVVNASPEPRVVEDMARRFGLTTRVVQVYFQNARARIRRRQNQARYPPQQQQQQQLETPASSWTVTSHGQQQQHLKQQQQKRRRPPAFRLDEDDSSTTSR